ncbi:MAG: BamA/TamA family outer membrane protein, partial [Alphaproteobacteria bacterium]|nr:BamA/TamA family outer membrane protein [Alphaproteobacteria bacterium]
TDLQNLDDDVSLVILQNAGVTIQSVIRNRFRFSSLNRRLNPTKGHFFEYGIDLAGLGGDVSYVRNKVSAGYFLPLLDRKFVLGIDGTVSYIQGLGRDVRITDVFFLGGDELRGFDDAGAGPRDLATLDAIGGKLSAYGTVELRFPNFLPEALGIGTSVFTDFGILTGTDASVPTLVDKGSPRASVGIGITWTSPLGPFRVDFAEAILKEDFDVTESFRISVGTTF